MKDLSTAEHQPVPSTQSTACSQMGMAGRKGRRELLTTTGLPSLPHPKCQRSTQTSPAAGCPRHTPTAGPGRNEAELNEPNKLSQVPHGTPAAQNPMFPFRAKLPFQKPKLQSLINLPNDENHPKTSSTAPVPTLCHAVVPMQLPNHQATQGSSQPGLPLPHKYQMQCSGRPACGSKRAQSLSRLAMPFHISTK